MNEFDVMDELGDKLDTVTGSGDVVPRVYRFPPDALAAPAYVVGYSESKTYDVSMGRGVDRAVHPVFLLVERTWDRAASEQLSVLTEAVKTAVQTKPNVAYSTARVMSYTTDVISVAGIEYWARTFLVDITGPGA